MEPACAVLEISPSTYYAAKKREENPSSRDERDEGLKKELMRARERKGRQLYGAKKMWRELNRDGIDVARCTVERLMSEMGVRCACAHASPAWSSRQPTLTIEGLMVLRRPSILEPEVPAGGMILYATLCTKVLLFGGGGVMGNEHVDAARTRPVRIVRLKVAPGDPRDLPDGPLAIVAELDPGPGQEELQWWMEQLRARVNVRAWGGSSMPRDVSPMKRRTASVTVDAPDDEFEAVARRLIAAVDEANADFPERYPIWRREHDAWVAEERLRRERRFGARQAILDRVMDEYRGEVR